MRIAFACAEVVPFAQTGGLGDVCGALPLALEPLGVDVDVYMPGYGCIDRRKHGIKRLSDNLSVKKVSRRVHVYFIDSPKYFARRGLYGSARGEYKDNLERFRHFSLSVLASIKHLKKRVDVLHCHDWHTALIPVYLKEYFAEDPFFERTRSLLTIHNLAYQGLFAAHKFKLLGLNKRLFSPACFEFWGRINFLKAGLIYSDRLNAVSPQYAKEIQTKKYGCGLERTVRANKRKLSGILNGLDYAIWDPRRDLKIVRRYGPARLDKAKAVNKSRWQKQLGLKPDAGIPLYGSVGRLSHQKGVDLFLEVLASLMKRELQLVVQGMGDRRYEKAIKATARKHKGRLVFFNTFGKRSSHMIYAASDFFLMPSNFEPCGLSQMISMRYATIPVVFHTGGLADTVRPHTKPNATGIVFKDYSAKGFLAAIDQAQVLFKNRTKINAMRANAMAMEFSWTTSAKKYVELYR